MAIAAFRLRRAVTLSSSFAVRRSISAFTSAPLLSTPVSSSPATAQRGAGATSLPSLGTFQSPYSLVQSLSFRSSASLGNRRTNAGVGEESKIGPDDILFEGCDYNHWLITMDFPKDPAPTREEMIETYVQTLAKVVGSVEEAKKRMYACSTTTYHGFQALMSEEMSEKFHGLPGVVFVLPDSYIDPVNKEYGGDKYDNGVITPRPPPVQYNRSRPRNQNRFDRPNYNRPPPQGNQPYDQQGQMQGGGGYNAPAYNYAQPGQDGRGYGEPDNRVAASGERRDFGQGQRNYPPPGGRENYQGERQNPHSPYQRVGNFTPQEPRNYSQGPGRDSRLAAPSGYQGERRDPHMIDQGDGPFCQDQNNYFQGSGYRDNRQDSSPRYDGGYTQQPGPSHNGENRQDMSSSYGGNHRQSEPGYAGESWKGSSSGYSQGNSGPQKGQPGPWQVY